MKGRRCERCLRLVEIVENQQNNALGRFTFERCRLGTAREVFGAAVQDSFLPERDVFLRVAVLVLVPQLWFYITSLCANRHPVQTEK
jgi:hypothetical protein